MRRVQALRARWRALGRRQQEWLVVALVAIVAAGLLGGLTTHDEIGWRQMTGFALAITFYAIFALGLSLEFGYTGLLNLGHVGFMAIGGYAYGVLLMSGGRPGDAAPIVGWLYDQAPNLEGATPLGFVACLFAALLFAALVLIPLLLTLESSARRAAAPAPRAGRRLVVALVLLAGGAALTRAALAAAPAGKPTTLAILLLTLFFGGVAAAFAGALLTLRWLLDALVARSPLARSQTARFALGGVLAAVVGVVVFVGAFPLSRTGALAMTVLLSTILGMVLAAVVALILGLPAIRLREDYLAIVTLGFAEILRSVILNEERWTRGAQPIQQFPRPVATWAADNDWWRDLAREIGVRAGDLALLVVSGVILAYVYVLLRALSDSPWGRVLRAIREDEEAVAALGKNVTWFKLQALMLGSAIAALAGVLYVSTNALVSVLQFLPIVTFYAFIIVVLGGIGNHRGAVIGAVILWAIFFGAQNAGLEAIGVEAGPSQLVFVGVVLIVVMMFRPQGLVGRKEELLFAK